MTIFHKSGASLAHVDFLSRYLDTDADPGLEPRMTLTADVSGESEDLGERNRLLTMLWADDSDSGAASPSQEGSPSPLGAGIVEEEPASPRQEPLVERPRVANPQLPALSEILAAQAGDPSAYGSAYARRDGMVLYHGRIYVPPGRGDRCLPFPLPLQALGGQEDPVHPPEGLQLAGTPSGRPRTPGCLPLLCAKPDRRLPAPGLSQPSPRRSPPTAGPLGPLELRLRGKGLGCAYHGRLAHQVGRGRSRRRQIGGGHVLGVLQALGLPLRRPPPDHLRPRGGFHQRPVREPRAAPGHRAVGLDPLPPRG
ncbi:MAG: uncharacterized protein KVP18_001230 [Porospora cf. gigantea A]|uniref:uncharacterized protein n=1 Tax=Porospora cf. gigantea A TaxID=2853593 RepID=UPI00355A89B5|nr:MAG: hypothetical protein KVP18_001230 [Porospora cf. gigantea A]